MSMYNIFLESTGKKLNHVDARHHDHHHQDYHDCFEYIDVIGVWKHQPVINADLIDQDEN